MTTTTMKRGALVTLTNGQIARVIGVRGGYVFTDLGTIDPGQIAPALDAATAARAFLDSQADAMRDWDNSALPSRKEYEAALAHVAALLKELEGR